MDDLGGMDATAVAAAISAGEVSALEVVEASVTAMAQRDPVINAVAQSRAEQALAEVAAGLPDGPLTGVPFVIKDLKQTVAGMINANGSRLFADRVARADSELVARYRRAGLVIIATTRTPEFGLNASTEPALGGAVRNPYRLSHSPAGPFVR